MIYADLKRGLSSYNCHRKLIYTQLIYSQQMKHAWILGLGCLIIRDKYTENTHDSRSHHQFNFLLN